VAEIACNEGGLCSPEFSGCDHPHRRGCGLDWLGFSPPGGADTHSLALTDGNEPMTVT